MGMIAYFYFSICFMCEEEEETIDHLLIHCKSAKMLWDLVCQLLGLVGSSRIRSCIIF